MSFYRSILATVAAMSLVGAVFADNTVSPAQPADNGKAMQTADATTTTTTTTTTDAAKVDLNKATANDLMKVKGLNTAKAKAIVAYRKKHGDFKSLDDLKLVKGFKRMKEDKFQQITNQLTLS